MANNYQESIEKAEKHISLIQEKLKIIKKELIEFKELTDNFSL